METYFPNLEPQVQTVLVLFLACEDGEHKDLLPMHRKQPLCDGAVVVAHWNSFIGNDTSRKL